MKDSVIAAAAIFILLSFAAVTTLSGAAALRPEAGVNRGVVELETGGSAGISVRIAEDLAEVVNDGATRRVLGGHGYRIVTEHHRLQASPRRRSCHTADGRARLRQAGELVSEHRVFDHLHH
jgi:hypothetical protein